jgi:hypothetical protein
MDRRKLYEALGAAGVTFVTGMAGYRSFSELTLDALYTPLIQGLIVGLSALGFRAIPSRGNGPADTTAGLKR